MTSLLPAYITGGAALLIAVGTNLWQFFRDRRQSKKAEIGGIEDLLRQKFEEYFLKSEELLQIFQKWLMSLGKAESNAEIDQELLTIEATLTMLETLYFPLFENEHNSTTKISYRLSLEFRKFWNQVQGLNEIMLAANAESRENELKGKWAELKKTFLGEADESRKFLASWTSSKLREQYRRSTTAR